MVDKNVYTPKPEWYKAPVSKEAVEYNIGVSERNTALGTDVSNLGVGTPSDWASWYQTRLLPGVQRPDAPPINPDLKKQSDAAASEALELGLKAQKASEFALQHPEEPFYVEKSTLSEVNNFLLPLWQQTVALKDMIVEAETAADEFISDYSTPWGRIKSEVETWDNPVLKFILGQVGNLLERSNPLDTIPSFVKSGGEFIIETGQNAVESAASGRPIALDQALEPYLSSLPGPLSDVAKGVISDVPSNRITNFLSDTALVGSELLSLYGTLASLVGATGMMAPGVAAKVPAVLRVVTPATMAYLGGKAGSSRETASPTVIIQDERVVSESEPEIQTPPPSLTPFSGMEEEYHEAQISDEPLWQIDEPTSAPELIERDFEPESKGDIGGVVSSISEDLPKELIDKIIAGATAGATRGVVEELTSNTPATSFRYSSGGGAPMASFLKKKKKKKKKKSSQDNPLADLKLNKHERSKKTSAKGSATQEMDIGRKR